MQPVPLPARQRPRQQPLQARPQLGQQRRSGWKRHPIIHRQVIGRHHRPEQRQHPAQQARRPPVIKLPVAESVKQQHPGHDRPELRQRRRLVVGRPHAQRRRQQEQPEPPIKWGRVCRASLHRQPQSPGSQRRQQRPPAHLRPQIPYAGRCRCKHQRQWRNQALKKG